jgi:hypothetical protein
VTSDLRIGSVFRTSLASKDPDLMSTFTPSISLKVFASIAEIGKCCY